MAVAFKQLDELLDVLQEYVPRNELKILLSQLERTEAAHANYSFKVTIMRLQDRHERRQKERKERADHGA